MLQSVRAGLAVAASLRRALTFTVAAMAGAAVCALPALPARAYEEDTHFTMTLVMCQVAGLSYDDALVVASYDQGIDDSEGTVAAGGLAGVIPNIAEEHLWHAIPQSGMATEVLLRKQNLWTQVISEKDPAKQLKRLAVFFHYQQDTWAHRKHYEAGYVPYIVPYGHAEDGPQPDRPPFDPVCALNSLEEGIGYVQQFIAIVQRRKAVALVDGKLDAKAGVDSRWDDGRKNKYFNQLALDPSTPASKFLTDLVRSQISAYTTSFDPNPKHLTLSGVSSSNPVPTLKTADEADYSTVRDRLLEACKRANVSVTIPTTRQKITTLTTSQLGGKSWGTRNYGVIIRTGSKLGAGTDSNIFLTIQGPGGVVWEQKMNGLAPGNPFESGQTDAVIFAGLESVGEIESITVRSDGTLPFADWYLESIEIQSPGLTTRRFTLNDWIDKDHLQRTIKRDQ